MFDGGINDGNDVKTAGLIAQAMFSEIPPGHRNDFFLFGIGHPAGGMSMRGAFCIFDFDECQRPLGIFGDAIDLASFGLEVP